MAGAVLLAGATVGAIDDADLPPLDATALPTPERPVRHSEELSDARVQAAERTARASVRKPSPTRKPTPEQSPELTDAGFPRVPGCDGRAPEEGTVANGQLDEEAHLCPVGDGERLRPAAAAAFVAMNTAYGEAMGDDLCITDSYRTLDEQYELKARKPYLSAPPGTSNHGWGIALDLSCGANTYGGAAYQWLEQHGDEYGWVNPAWARAGGSQPEPWHWEYDPGLL